MTLEQENEQLRTQAIVDAAEIARLQSGFEELKQWVLDAEFQEMLYQGNMSEYFVVSEYLLDEINRITGVEK